MPRVILFFALLSFCPLACAQSVGAGFKGGVVFGDWTQPYDRGNGILDQSDDYTFGPYVEFRLPWSLAVELDALYKPYRRFASGGIGGYGTTFSVDAKTWEFPILGKYRFPLRPVTPFVLGGVTFRHMGTQDTVWTCTGSLCGTSEGTFTDTRPGFTRTGVIVGGGFEWKVSAVRLAAEARYTGINSSYTSPTIGTPWMNQATLLFSIGF